MAAPVDATEQAFRLRRFSGTNTMIDPVFLGPQLVALAQNWIPNQTYRLSKRPGSRLYVRTGQGVTGITAIARYYDQLAGHRYLYWYGQRPGAGAGLDNLFRTVDDGAVSGPLITAPALGQDEALGRLIRYGEYLYVGNGIDNLRQVKITDASVTELVPLTTLAVTAPLGDSTLESIPATDTGAIRLQTGSYAFCWAVYNTVTKLYVSRSDPLTAQVEKDQFFRAKAPAAAPGTNQVYRLFVAPDGWPIEYATAQGGDFTTGGDTRDLTAFDVTESRVPVTNNVARTGNMFTIFRGRVVFAGNELDVNAVCATGVILPGLEQDEFNQGAFFPAWARLVLPGPVSGVGVSGATGAMDPRSPLVAFTATKTFLFLGDPFDPEDTSAVQVQLSDRVGCPAHDTIVPTAEGLVFMGVDSVYLLGSDGSPPRDIGWPIADQIRAIPAGSRSLCCAIYHKYFYKLAIPGPAGGSNALQWWLDLRQGLGEIPSWWGPHVGPPTSAFATALSDDDEQDKGFLALADTDAILLHHQMNLYWDYYLPGATQPSVAIRSVLRSGVFDADQPFIAKVFTRVRAIGRSAAPTQINVAFYTDGGTLWAIDPIIFEGPEGSHWFGGRPPPAQWGPGGRAKWLHLGPLEVQTITPAERPRGLSVEVVLSHTDPTDVQLRDFEVLFLPVARKVRYLGERVPK
jgi:hypothetical protein